MVSTITSRTFGHPSSPAVTIMIMSLHWSSGVRRSSWGGKPSFTSKKKKLRNETSLAQPPELNLSSLFSSGKMKEVLPDVLLLLGYDEEIDGDIDNIWTYNNVGDGCIAVAIWSKGNIIVQWDGRRGMDINIFTALEVTKTSHDSFLKQVTKTIPFLYLLHREEQPRGYGRVIYFGEQN
mmetsp:Transcript_34483/g.79710  ORF Transcript_34483/g.79710 Transcript_34483/m.79710 type:complete len:179 (-) Transcript_34483:328-864(-)